MRHPMCQLPPAATQLCASILQLLMMVAAFEEDIGCGFHQLLPLLQPHVKAAIASVPDWLEPFLRCAFSHAITEAASGSQPKWLPKLLSWLGTHAPAALGRPPIMLLLLLLDYQAACAKAALLANHSGAGSRQAGYHESVLAAVEAFRQELQEMEAAKQVGFRFAMSTAWWYVSHAGWEAYHCTPSAV